MKFSNIFFIVGSQRSGTTLLRLMLNAHSEIAIPEEGGFWMPLLRKYKRSKKGIIQGSTLNRYIEYIKNNPQFKLWQIDANSVFDQLKAVGSVSLQDLMSQLYETYAHINGKGIWGDKTPSFFRMIPILQKLFPNARYVHLIRDGRDVFLSRKKIDPDLRSASVGALEWLFKVRKARNDLGLVDSAKSIELKYEDLVESPVRTLKSLCRFLNISFEQNMLDFWMESDRFIGAHHSELIFQPVSPQSVGKWERMMTPKELRRFESIAGGELVRSGYELSYRRKSPFEAVASAVLDLALALPARLARILLNALNMGLVANYGIKLFEEDVGRLPVKALGKKE